ncbi:MAG: sodium:calcium antiporter [Candidatus Margulisbacteria bacterium]|nr:sodium:calcium antiporter [Candidatus Margulisiibacteriota bacterium]MBU1021921.1 sodium:calcium antiporter [Candidatus Margulisiibacteriota bacterium]MBU1728559.1 sodium:calcium antiporter [Candidatus Margulisiibacteriota bacterium]MBU1954706.1 sodium:calcium antiporter [Candidatus Margulisiibacteriota bacterium]
MFIIWLKFALCAIVILYAGSRISKYGDVISEKSGLSRLWIGAVLLATITSLPELANSISAVTSVQAPNLAAGDIFGACLINMFLIGVLDLIYNVKGRGPILGNVEIGHILTAITGIILLAVAAGGIVIEHSHPPVSIFSVGLFTFAIFIIYIIGSRIIFGFEKKRQEEFMEKKVHTIEKHEYKDISTFSAYSRFAMFALLIVLAGSWLPIIGRQIAELSGWGQTFVGTVFLGFATTLPELVVSFSALSIGAIDMAIGNLLGSNVFNILILFVADVFYSSGSLLSVISIDHIITAVAAIVMTGVAILGLVYRSEKRNFRHISWDAYTLIFIFVLTWFLLYRLGMGI